ncbi:type II toxin-antitoxin system RelE/ParE family toxin [Aquibium sp. ELW1220]|uniref:type II toxin-antitoxin system RelE/ParE family toxin n=1 Tax=Aquibium sp. ELW1220 TaxID=2976766 RepID=UPI0025B06094|nr:type II toxin-antitoxin system RelE/ParE family toxin [Aquibium sp. ELW1220]MDN2581857.1 type II toxin-antitoxin system RelE/ParE family toxin [Aquibium sp. ELW1220]
MNTGQKNLASVVIFDYSHCMTETRSISWIKAAKKDFEDFPRDVQTEALRALTIAAEGQKADNAKPLTGHGGGILEIVLRYRTDAYRVVYATQIGDDLWVIHAFQKKSKSGISTPQHEVDLIRTRIKRLKEALS